MEIMTVRKRDSEGKWRNFWCFSSIQQGRPVFHYLLTNFTSDVLWGWLSPTRKHFELFGIYSVPKLAVFAGKRSSSSRSELELCDLPHLNKIWIDDWWPVVSHSLDQKSKARDDRVRWPITSLRGPFGGRLDSRRSGISRSDCAESDFYSTGPQRDRIEEGGGGTVAKRMSWMGREASRVYVF